MLVSLAAILVVESFGRNRGPDDTGQHPALHADALRRIGCRETGSLCGPEPGAIEPIRPSNSSTSTARRSFSRAARWQAACRITAFTVQSEKFDYLLDLDGNIIQVADGEVYVPLSYLAGWPRRGLATRFSRAGKEPSGWRVSTAIRR